MASIGLTTRAGFKRLLLVGVPALVLALAGLWWAGVNPVLLAVAAVLVVAVAALIAVELTMFRVNTLLHQVQMVRDQQDKQARAVANLRTHVTTMIEKTSLNEFRQTEALLVLHQVLDLPRPLPATRGWAASPDLLVVLEREVTRNKPMLVVECGGGVSSIVIAHRLREFGGRLVVLEHDAEFAEITRRNLAEQGVADVVDVRHAPLASVDGLVFHDHVFQWYDTAAIDDLAEIDLLVVDGPPEATGSFARYPAVPLLWSRLSSRAVVVMDDTIREAEQTISEAWQADHPDLRVEELRLEKGCHILRR